MVRRFYVPFVCEKAAALGIAISQAGIAAQTLTVMQGFEGTKNTKYRSLFSSTRIKHKKNKVRNLRANYVH